TGWFKGVDGKWRFEIDDSRSVFNERAVTREMPSRHKLAERIVTDEMGLPRQKIFNDADVQSKAYGLADQRLAAAREAERGQPLMSALTHDEMIKAYPAFDPIGVAR